MSRSTRWLGGYMDVSLYHYKQVECFILQFLYSEQSLGIKLCRAEIASKSAIFYRWNGLNLDGTYQQIE